MSQEDIMKEELKQQMKEEVKRQMKEELEREALKEQIRRELRAELKDEVQKEIQQQKQDKPEAKQDKPEVKQDSKVADDKLDQNKSARQRTTSYSSSDSDNGSVHDDVVRKASPIPARGGDPTDVASSANGGNGENLPPRPRTSSRSTSDQQPSTRSTQGRSTTRRSSSNASTSGQDRRASMNRSGSRRGLLTRRNSGSHTRTLMALDDDAGSEMEGSFSRLRRRASISNILSDKGADYSSDAAETKGNTSELEKDDVKVEKKKDQDKSSRPGRRVSMPTAQHQQQQQHQQQPAQPPPSQQSPTTSGGATGGPSGPSGGPPSTSSSAAALQAPESPGSPLRRFGKGLFPFGRGNRGELDAPGLSSGASVPEAPLELEEDDTSVEDVIQPNTPGHDIFAYFLPEGEHIVWVEIELPDEEKLKRKAERKEKRRLSSSDASVKPDDIIQYPELNIHLAAREVSTTQSRSNPKRNDEPFRPVGPLRESTTEALVQVF